MIRWQFGSCAFSERNAAGFYSYQPDYFGEQKSGGPPLENIAPHGFLSRPRDPDVGHGGTPGKGAGLLYFYDGDDAFAYPGPDPRYFALLPDVAKGGALLYATLASGGWVDVSTLALDGDTGSLKIRIPYAAGTKTMLVEADTANDRFRVTHASGVYLEVNGGAVVLGGGGAAPLALAAPLTAFLTAVAAALTALGHSPGPVPAIATTLAKGV